MTVSSLRHFFVKNNYQYAFMLFSLWAHVQAAICSTGYHHADEHFQLLEPLGWKLGLYPPDGLAWEFTDKIRPGLQIFMGVCIARLLDFFGLYSPFLLTAVLRQLSGLLSWALCWAFYNKWKQEVSLPVQQKALLLCTALLWFFPYLHVRYSSENWGSLFFLGGVYCVLYLRRSLFDAGSLLVGGLLMGLSFYFRFQMGFAIAGLLAWMLLSRQYRLADYAWLFLGGLCGAAIGTLTDYWLYDTWTITPYNYFFQNIVANKAAGFGVSPFYSYIPYFIEAAAPPVSIVLLVLLACGVWAGCRHPLVWVLVTFLVAHSAVGHKELRFLFPMVPLLPLVCALGLPVIKGWFKDRRVLFQRAVQGFVIINVGLMTFTLLKPANDREALFKAFYIIHQQNSATKIAFAEKDPFDNGLPMNFFKYCATCFYKLEQLPADDSKPFYLYSSRIGGLPFYKGVEAKLTYSTAPILPEKFNIGHWQERSNKGFLWKISLKRNE